MSPRPPFTQSPKTDFLSAKYTPRDIITTPRVPNSTHKGLKFDYQSPNSLSTGPKSTSRARKLALRGQKSTLIGQKIDSQMPTNDYQRPKIDSNLKLTPRGLITTPRVPKSTLSCLKFDCQSPIRRPQAKRRLPREEI